MKKAVIILVLLICSSCLLAQVDTTLNYRERFYTDGKLKTTNTLTENKKEGLWIEYYDKKWNECSKSKSRFYRLIEYKNSLPVGKVYDFYNSGQVQMAGTFLTIDPEMRSGTFVWYSKNGKSESIKYYTPDTLMEQYYYKNGRLMRKNIRRMGHDDYSYEYSFWYYKNGNPHWIHYADDEADTLYYLAGRRNGSIDIRDINSKCNSERIKQNRKGELIEKENFNCKSDSIFVEKFANGKTISRSVTMKAPPWQPYAEYKAISYYQGSVGGNSGVVIIDMGGTKQYSVNGVKMTEAEYIKYKEEYDKYIESRKPKHFYKYYTADSILVFEGLFKNVDLPCGLYNEYYPDKKFKTMGGYDRKGRKSGLWMYYNEKGEWLFTELYKKGTKKR